MVEFEKSFTSILTGNSLKVIARPDTTRHYVAIYAVVRAGDNLYMTNKLAHGMFTTDSINACDYDLAKFLTEGSLKTALKSLGFCQCGERMQEVLDYIKNPH